MPLETAKKINHLASVSPLPHFASFARGLEHQIQTLRAGLLSLPKQDSRRKIHDLRVLSRRTRAAAAVLFRCISSKQSKPLKKALQRLTALLGPVRSLDVSRLDLKKRLKNTKTSSRFFDFFLNQLRKKRKRAREVLMEELKKHRINQRLKDTSAFHPGEEPSSDIFLKAILKKARCSGEDLLKAWKRFEKKTRLADLHEVRIDLKKWRYLLEIQSQYTASPDSAHLKKMKAAQDRLGRIHDVEVLHDLLKTAEIPKKYRNKKGPKELNRMKKELKSQLKTDLHSFHRDGEKILLNLYSERRGA